MRKIYTGIGVVSLLSFFTFGCSGDGRGRFDTGSTNVAVGVCETYTPIAANDLLVKDSDNTTIKIIHDQNGSKSICVVSGSAHIVREAQ